MQITVNGQPMHLDDAPSVAELLSRLGHADRRVAVERNHAIVPRSRHAVERLTDGDSIEIVQAFGGG